MSGGLILHYRCTCGQSGVEKSCILMGMHRHICLWVLVSHWARGLCYTHPNQFAEPVFYTLCFWPVIVSFKTLRETTWRSQRTKGELIHVVRMEKKKKHSPHIFHKFKINESVLTLSFLMSSSPRQSKADLLHGWSFYWLPAVFLVVPVWVLNGGSRCKTTIQAGWKTGWERLACYLFKIRL